MSLLAAAQSGDVSAISFLAGMLLSFLLTFVIIPLVIISHIKRNKNEPKN